MDIQFHFYMGIMLVVISNNFYFQQESISRKIHSIILVACFFLFPNMLICPSDISSSTNVIMLGQVSTSKRCFLLSLSTQLLKKSLEINLLFKPQTTDFINQIEQHVSIRHNSRLTLIKSGALFFGIDIMYIIYLHVKYFSAVCLSTYCEKPAVKNTLATMRYVFAKKLNYCLSDIICNSVALKSQCLKHNF